MYLPVIFSLTRSVCQSQSLSRYSISLMQYNAYLPFFQIQFFPYTIPFISFHLDVLPSIPLLPFPLLLPYPLHVILYLYSDFSPPHSFFLSLRPTLTPLPHLFSPLPIFPSKSSFTFSLPSLSYPFPLFIFPPLSLPLFPFPTISTTLFPFPL